MVPQVLTESEAATVTSDQRQPFNSLKLTTESFHLYVADTRLRNLYKKYVHETCTIFLHQILI